MEVDISPSSKCGVFVSLLPSAGEVPEVFIDQPVLLSPNQPERYSCNPEFKIGVLQGRPPSQTSSPIALKI